MKYLAKNLIIFIGILWGALFAGCAVERADSINYMSNLTQNILDFVDTNANEAQSALPSQESQESQNQSDNLALENPTIEESQIAEKSKITEKSEAKIVETANSAESSDNKTANSAESTSLNDDLKKQYLAKYFSVWGDSFSIPKSSDMFWAIYAKKGFDETKKPLNEDFFKEIIESMSVESYPSMRKKAVMIKTTSVRVLPTNKPRFSKSDGYPFDRWQNSLIFAYTPIIVLHTTKNKEWLLVQSSFVSGWVKADEVAFMSIKLAKEMQNGEFLLPLKDNIPLYHNDLFLQNAMIGMLFLKGSTKITSRNNSKLTKPQIIAYKRDLKGNAIKVKVDFDESDFASFPMPFSEVNIAKTIASIGAQNYGWGGLYDNRDCSSFIRDVFASVGIWLPRNSKAQVLYGKVAKESKYLDLPKDNDEKIAFIRKFAKPFRTIIWLKGHIMLYIGEIKGAPIVAHQVWGISNKNGSEILGSVSITTLTPQINITSPNFSDSGSKKTLLDRIEAINIIR